MSKENPINMNQTADIKKIRIPGHNQLKPDNSVMDLLPIKKSHIMFYNQFSLYYKTKSGEVLLYKKPEKNWTMIFWNETSIPSSTLTKSTNSR